MLLVFLKTKEFMVQLQTSITFYYDYLLKKFALIIITYRIERKN